MRFAVCFLLRIYISNSKWETCSCANLFRSKDIENLRQLKDDFRQTKHGLGFTFKHSCAITTISVLTWCTRLACRRRLLRRRSYTRGCSWSPRPSPSSPPAARRHGNPETGLTSGIIDKESSGTSLFTGRYHILFITFLLFPFFISSFFSFSRYFIPFSPRELADWPSSWGAPLRPSPSPWVRGRWRASSACYPPPWRLGRTCWRARLRWRRGPASTGRRYTGRPPPGPAAAWGRRAGPPGSWRPYSAPVHRSTHRIR